MWVIPDRQKFALVAIQNCDADVTAGATFPNGTVVLTSIDEWIDEQWKRWLGESRSEALAECNLILLRHAPSDRPEILDDEHQQLTREVNAVFTLLAFEDVPNYERASSVRGSFIAPRKDVRQMGELDPLYRTDGFPRVDVTDARVAAADALLPNWLAITNSQEFHRLKLAIGSLLSGLQEGYGEERIHQYARALEGLILPDIGSSTRQFVHRCTTFAGMSEDNRRVLTDAYNMRSATEHLHPWDSALQQYPAQDRESVALRRTRQMERLAGFALRHVLGTPSLHEWFRNDAKIAEFWQFQDHERAKIWGTKLNISAVA